MVTPNGIGLSPDGSRIYIAETQTGRLWAFALDGPGEVRKSGGFPYPGGTLVAGLGGLQLFDSLALESSGNICVATLLTGAITVISPDGAIVDVVKIPGESYVTNICFSGEDLRTAYITASGTGRLIEMQWPRPGLRLNA
jgi:gluconolactonase